MIHNNKLIGRRRRERDERTVLLVNIELIDWRIGNWQLAIGMAYLQLKLWSVELQEVEKSKEIVSVNICIHKNPMRRTTSTSSCNNQRCYCNCYCYPTPHRQQRSNINKLSLSINSRGEYIFSNRKKERRINI